jgi:hypothetical protein
VCVPTNSTDQGHPPENEPALVPAAGGVVPPRSDSVVDTGAVDRDGLVLVTVITRGTPSLSRAACIGHPTLFDEIPGPTLRGVPGTARVPGIPVAPDLRK